MNLCIGKTIQRLREVFENPVDKKEKGVQKSKFSKTRAFKR